MTQDEHEGRKNAEAGDTKLQIKRAHRLEVKSQPRNPCEVDNALSRSPTIQYEQRPAGDKHTTAKNYRDVRSTERKAIRHVKI